MAYNNEKASKFAYHTIINDPMVKDYLSKCFIPDIESITTEEIENFSIPLEEINDISKTDIKKLIAIDGGYQIVSINTNYPSAKIAYYSAGVLSFNLDLFEDINQQLTVDPNDIVNLKKLHKQNFQLPLQNLKLIGETFVDSTRKTIFNIFETRSLFEKKEENSSLDIDTILIDTIKWLVFEEYRNDDKKGKGTFTINCPNPNCDNKIHFRKINEDYKDKNDKLLCKSCHDKGIRTVIYLTDVFEMHEIVDEIQGAGAITSTLLNVFEIILLFTVFRFSFEKHNIDIMSKYIFLKDGSLAIFSKNNRFSGDKIFKFISFMYEESIKKEKNLMNIVGLDKSGYFMEHLKNIEPRLLDRHLFVPNLEYIQNNIIGDKTIFGLGSYFGFKFIYKHNNKLSFVFDIPMPVSFQKSSDTAYIDFIKKPIIKKFINLKVILNILIELKCDIYEKSFIPIVLINKQVSVSEKPGRKLLTLFTKEELLK